MASLLRKLRTTNLKLLKNVFFLFFFYVDSFKGSRGCFFFQLDELNGSNERQLFFWHCVVLCFSFLYVFFFSLLLF